MPDAVEEELLVSVLEDMEVAVHSDDSHCSPAVVDDGSLLSKYVLLCVDTRHSQ